MLRDTSVQIESEWGAHDTSAQDKSCREVDRQLRRIAKRRGGLDADEARWLREMERLRAWRPLGYATALEYLEDVFGYAPRTAVERLRVARELGQLPALDAELRAGTLSYSATRELSRVATPATEAAWLERARGKNLRDIEELVSGHDKGDGPDDPKDPDLDLHDLTLKDLTPAARAMMRQMRQLFEEECGESLNDSQLIEAVGRRVIDGAAPKVSGKAPRPAHRISIRTCDSCKRASVVTAGKTFDVGASVVEKARCDAELFGDEDTDAPRRLTQTIPPKTRELVWRRDGGCCRYPGCRSARNLDWHHIRFRSEGGDHSPSNIVLLCSGHHQLLHEGIVTITGTAPDQLVFTRDGQLVSDARAPEEVAAGQALAQVATRNRFDEAAIRAQALAALKVLGYPSRVSKQALDDVMRVSRAERDVGAIVKAVMRRLRPTTPVRDDSATRSSVDGESNVSMARKALVQSGYDRAVAAAAVQAASAHVGEGADLATLLREALRRCGKT